MTADRFISPTIQFLYDQNPDWPRDTETLYKYGFSKWRMTDVHGYDVYGFNSDGVDRLGCTVADYENPEVRQIASLAGDRFSLSNRLSTPLPAFLALRPVFERLCGQRWDTVPGWKMGFCSLPDDGRKHMFFDLQSELAIGIYWFDEMDRRDNYFMIQTDVIAKLGNEDGARGVPFRITSVSSGSNYETVADVCFATGSVHARAILEEHIDRYLQPVRSWTILIQESPDGPILGAFAASEMDDVAGDPVLAPVVARSREEALQSVLDNAKTATVRDMASGGIAAIVGQPALYREPRPM